MGERGAGEGGMTNPMNEYRQLIGLFRKRRLQRGLTQIDLCSRMGLTDNFVNRWENLRSFPKGPMLIEWAQALNLRLGVSSVHEHLVIRPWPVGYASVEEREKAFRKLEGR